MEFKSSAFLDADLTVCLHKSSQSILASRKLPRLKSMISAETSPNKWKLPMQSLIPQMNCNKMSAISPAELYLMQRWIWLANKGKVFNRAWILREMAAQFIYSDFLRRAFRSMELKEMKSSSKCRPWIMSTKAKNFA